MMTSPPAASSFSFTTAASDLEPLHYVVVNYLLQSVIHIMYYQSAFSIKSAIASFLLSAIAFLH